MTAITVLGLGAMGSRIAARLAADADHTVTVWNRTTAASTALADEPDVTVEVASNARAAVAGADIVLSMVTDDEASRSLWLDPDTGVLAALSQTAVAIEASTITRRHAVTLGTAASEADIAFLEAPVVGSRPQAEAGALVALVGGDAETLDRVRPALASYTAAIRHLGPIGAAATAKLAINGLFGLQVAAYAEIVGLLERTGVPVDDAVDVLGGLPITSPGLQRILGLFAARDFAPNFPVALVAKDLGYLRALAAEADAETPLTEAAAAVFQAGAAGPQADLDIAGIAERYLPPGWHRSRPASAAAS
ncbi:MAG: NAD(P)-dependent oxidoreductase [Actinomycetota bacterium]